MRAGPAEGFAANATAADGRLLLTLDAIDRQGRFINQAETTVAVRDAGEGRGERKKSRFERGQGGRGSRSLLLLLRWARARVRAKRGKTQPIPLTQVAPGRYSGLVPAAAAEPRASGRPRTWSRLTAQVRRDGQPVDTVRGGTVALKVPEPTARGEGDLASTEKTGLRTTPVWHWLLAAGLAVLMIDLAVRRLTSIGTRATLRDVSRFEYVP